MNTRISFVILIISVLWSLSLVASSPTSEDVQDLRQKTVIQDQVFLKCCLSLRATDPSHNCKSCADKLEPLEPITETPSDTKKTLGVECVRTHSGCHIPSKDDDENKESLKEESK